MVSDTTRLNRLAATQRGTLGQNSIQQRFLREIAPTTLTTKTMRRLRLPQFRFSLRTFLIVCVVPVPILAWLANVKVTAVKQRAAIAQLESQGLVHVMLQRPTPFFPTNLIRAYVDQDAFDIASRVYPNALNSPFTRRSLKSADFEALPHLNGLRHLSLGRRSLMSTLDHCPDRVVLPTKTQTKLSTIQTLKSLSVDADFDPETQLKLAQLPEMHSLHLPGTKVTNEMLQVLGQSDKISSLDINASLVTAKGLEGLARAPVLQTLMLRQLPGELRLLKSLSNCKALTHLQVNSSRLTAEDANYINALPIQSLSLFRCEIEPGFLASLIGSRTLSKLQIVAKGDDGMFISREGSLDSLGVWEDHFALKVPPKSSTDPTSP